MNYHGPRKDHHCCNAQNRAGWSTAMVLGDHRCGPLSSKLELVLCGPDRDPRILWRVCDMPWFEARVEYIALRICAAAARVERRQPALGRWPRHNQARHPFSVRIVIIPRRSAGTRPLGLNCQIVGFVCSAVRNRRAPRDRAGRFFRGDRHRNRDGSGRVMKAKHPIFTFQIWVCATRRAWRVQDWGTAVDTTTVTANGRRDGDNRCIDVCMIVQRNDANHGRNTSPSSANAAR